MHHRFVHAGAMLVRTMFAAPTVLGPAFLPCATLPSVRRIERLVPASGGVPWHGCARSRTIVVALVRDGVVAVASSCCWRTIVLVATLLRMGLLGALLGHGDGEVAIRHRVQDMLDGLLVEHILPRALLLERLVDRKVGTATSLGRVAVNAMNVGIVREARCSLLLPVQPCDNGPYLVSHLNLHPREHFQLALVAAER